VGSLSCKLGGRCGQKDIRISQIVYHLNDDISVASMSLIPEWQGFLTESLPNLTALRAPGAAWRGAGLSDPVKVSKSGYAHKSRMPQSQKSKCGGAFERCGLLL